KLQSNRSAQAGLVSDERLAHLETQPYLREVVFERTTYRRYREGWDHDHYAACWAKFAVQGSDPRTSRAGGLYDHRCLSTRTAVRMGLRNLLPRFQSRNGLD